MNNGLNMFFFNGSKGLSQETKKGITKRKWSPCLDIHWLFVYPKDCTKDKNLVWVCRHVQRTKWTHLGVHFEQITWLHQGVVCSTQNIDYWFIKFDQIQYIGYLCWCVC